MITVYGIPNCDSVKKGLKLLENNNIDFQFHSFKKEGLDAKTVKNWLKIIPLQDLINKKGTTYRGLSDEEKLKADDKKEAVELALSNTSIIKRPVIDWGNGKITVGYSESLLQNI